MADVVYIHPAVACDPLCLRRLQGATRRLAVLYQGRPVLRPLREAARASCPLYRAAPQPATADTGSRATIAFAREGGTCRTR